MAAEEEEEAQQRKNAVEARGAAVAGSPAATCAIHAAASSPSHADCQQTVRPPARREERGQNSAQRAHERLGGRLRCRHVVLQQRDEKHEKVRITRGQQLRSKVA